VVVANPPYMGSSSFNAFMSKWIKKNYPDVKSDLCTCFIERGYGLAKDRGYSAMVTMQSWMFLGSFEKMRSKLIAEKGIVTMAHLGPRAFDAIGGEVVSVTADVLYNGRCEVPGAYFRLVDLNGSEPKRQALLEAIKNPTCGWFYRRDASTFHQIPGSPIAYWVGDGLLRAYATGKCIDEVARPKVGMQTSNNSKYLRLWWETDWIPTDATGSHKWIKYLKGGSFRKWSGNLEYVLFYNNDPNYILEQPHARVLPLGMLIKPKITCTMLTSGKPGFRTAPSDTFYDIAAHCCFPSDQDYRYVLGLLNSSVASLCLALQNPTMNMQVSDIAAIPFIGAYPLLEETISGIVAASVELSKLDWDSFETSWDFKRHPLV